MIITVSFFICLLAENYCSKEAVNSFGAVNCNSKMCLCYQLPLKRRQLCSCCFLHQVAVIFPLFSTVLWWARQSLISALENPRWLRELARSWIGVNTHAHSFMHCGGHQTSWPNELWWAKQSLTSALENPRWLQELARSWIGVNTHAHSFMHCGRHQTSWQTWSPPECSVYPFLHYSKIIVWNVCLDVLRHARQQCCYSFTESRIWRWWKRDWGKWMPKLKKKRDVRNFFFHT